METNAATLTAKAIAAVADRLDAIEARIVATDLWIAAIMRHVPDRAAVLDSLEQSIDPNYLDSSAQSVVPKTARDRARRLLHIYRKG